MKTRYLLTLTLVVLLVVITGASAYAGPALVTPDAAKVFTVTKTADTNDGACSANDCSLREAIIAANALPGADTIVLPAGLYALSIEGRGEDAAASGDLDIGDAARIVGAGAESTFVDGGQKDRVFHVLDGDVTFEGLTIRNGRSLGPIGGGGLAIQEGGRVSIISSVIAANEAASATFGCGSEAAESKVSLGAPSFLAGGCNGGGISNFGELHLSHSTVRQNIAFRGGGIFHEATGHALVISQSAIVDNSSLYYGGIDVWGNMLVLVNSTVARNYAGFVTGGIGGGGRIINSTITSNDGFYDDGGLSGTFELQNSIVAGNTSGRLPSCSGTMVSLGHNIIGDGSLCEADLQPSDRIGDPLLAPIVDTMQAGVVYYPLASTSPAIDAADVVACPDTDQIGGARVDGDGDGVTACDIGAIEYQPPYVDGGQNLLDLKGWAWGRGTIGVKGAVADGVLGIKALSAPARACWYQDIDGVPLRNTTVRLEAEMRKTALMNEPDPPFTNPYISLQVRKNNGDWIYNFGGILNSRSVPGGPWISEARDILLPNDMTTLRAAFCLWNATPGTAEARNFLLRRAVAPPPPPSTNLLLTDWTWAPANPGLTSSQAAGVFNIQVDQAGARGCWIQDLPGAALQGKSVQYAGAMSKTTNMNAPYGFVNPYISLQVRTGDGSWAYNYPNNTILNSSAVPGGPFVMEVHNYTLPTDMVTLRAAFCVWDAAPGVASGKDFVLKQIVTALGEEAATETWDVAGPDTPSVLPEDGVMQPETTLRYWLPLIRN